MKLGLRMVLVLLASVSCSPAPGVPDDARPSLVDEDGDPPARADRVEVVRGVPARGRDPGVVAIEIGSGRGLCSGSLVSSRLVLTARHCVSKTVSSVLCPPDRTQVLGDLPASELAIRVGEDVTSSRIVAHGIAIVAPAGLTLCEADIALVVLDEPISLVKPLPIRSRGPATGDHVRAVGFGRTSDDGAAGKKLVREHVRVRSVAPAEFTVGEATCLGDSGGPALDEDTGEIIGVVSRGGPSCDGAEAYNVYTRVDAWAWLVEEAFTHVAEIDRAERIDAGSSSDKLTRPSRGTRSRPPSDIGGPCETGDDCGAGVCLIDGERKYCTRPCGSGDRCPTRYHCEPVDADGSLCVNVR